MAMRITALILIFAASTVGWMVLGGVTEFRTSTQDRNLKEAVGQLWGTAHRQETPKVYFERKVKQEINTGNDGNPIYETRILNVNSPESMVESDIDVKLDLEHRKKGLLWYSTYKVDFLANYVVRNISSSKRKYIFKYSFPSPDGIYDNFALEIGASLFHDDL